MTAVGKHTLTLGESYGLDYSDPLCSYSMRVKTLSFGGRRDKLKISCRKLRVLALQAPKTTSHKHDNGVLSGIEMSKIGNSSNIVWHKCSVEKRDREKLNNQKGCVIWITGLSGSGKSTLACALSHSLHARGKLAYVLDGDNCRHGLNRDLRFNTEDRVENIRRIGEVAKLFSDAGVICIASLISPFRKERDAIRALFPEGDFIEVYMNVPLEVCETRDPKGLYKLARAGKIKGFTGIDDPYEPPLNSEIVLNQSQEMCDRPNASAEKVIAYLEIKGYLEA